MTSPIPVRATAVVLACAVLVACGADAGQAGDDTSGLAASLLETGAPPAPSASIQEAPMDMAALGYDAGSPDALIQVVEFSDFGCGYCARFHSEVFPSLEREYIAQGKVEWKYIPMILGLFGPNAEVAARAGECAGEQGRFPAMRDRIFARQGDWKRAADPRGVLDDLAREVELDMDRYSRCVEEGWRDARIAAGTQLSRQAGVRGTPTFFVVGYGAIPGMLPLDVFRQVLDTVYAERVRARR